MISEAERYFSNIESYWSVKKWAAPCNREQPVLFTFRTWSLPVLPVPYGWIRKQICLA